MTLIENVPAATRPLNSIEIRILRLSAAGLTLEEIAGRLRRSVETVKTYRRSMLKKTKTKNVAAIIALAFRSGWLC